MAKRARSGGDLISTITDTIASHPRLSAAVAFQMGVLLGQVINNRDATFSALKRSVTSAPEALASALPAFGLFGGDEEPARKPARRGGRTGRKTRKRKTAR